MVRLSYHASVVLAERKQQRLLLAICAVEVLVDAKDEVTLSLGSILAYCSVDVTERHLIIRIRLRI